MLRLTGLGSRLSSPCAELGFSGYLSFTARLHPRLRCTATFIQVERAVGTQYRSPDTRKTQDLVTTQPTPARRPNGRLRLPCNGSSLSISIQKAHFCNTGAARLRSALDYSRPFQTTQHSDFWKATSLKVLLVFLGVYAIARLGSLGYEMRDQMIREELTKTAHHLHVLLIRERHYRGLDEKRDCACWRLDDRTKQSETIKIETLIERHARDLEERGIKWERYPSLLICEGIWYDNYFSMRLNYFGVMRETRICWNSRAHLDGVLKCQK